MLDDNLEHAHAPPTLKEGRYIIAGVLGKGGNAGVYKAWDTKLRCWRAVKVLSHEYIKDDQVRARFAQEASTMARLDHRNLVSVYDISDDPFTPHIVMELCSGGSVIGWLKTHGAAPPRLALHIVESTARGVAVAHEQGITHRDIKPQNILLDHKGVVKLTDFGIARNADNSLTMAGVTMGTYAFMAPEQRHDSTKVDERADVYSLGATLFNLCQLKTTTELFVAERDDELFEGLPDPIIDVILKACAYRPRERFANIDELVEGIAAARAKLPEDPEHPPLDANAAPLPEEAPSDLPDLSQLEDLLKALALNDNTPTYQPPSEKPAPNEDTTLGETSGVPLPERKALPYYMTAKPTEIPRDQPTRPSYLADEEVKRQKVEAARKAADKVLAKRRAAEVEAARAKEEAERPMIDPQIVYGAIGLVALGLLVFGGIIAFGTNAVSVSHQEVTRSEASLLDAVESAAPVLSQLDGDDAESTFWKFRDAEGEQRVELALQFADQLEAASAGQELGGVGDGLVKSVGKTASKYRSSVDNASTARASFAGDLAIRVGTASEHP